MNKSDIEAAHVPVTHVPHPVPHLRIPILKTARAAHRRVASTRAPSDSPHLYAYNANVCRLHVGDIGNSPCLLPCRHAGGRR